MKQARCLYCKSTMEKWKEDSYRFWFKCSDEECDYVSTEAKPLVNKTIEIVPSKKKNGKKKKLDKKK